MLIKKLAELQNERQMNHKDFAALLGISGSYWCQLRYRYGRPSAGVVRAMALRFPEFAQYSTRELPRDDAIVPYWNEHRQACGRGNITNLSRARRNEDGACYFCGSVEELEAHHLDLQGERSDEPHHAFDNLVTLCTPCHNKLHRVIRRLEGRLKAAVANPEVIVHVKVSKSNCPDLNRLIDMAVRDAVGEPLESIGSSYGLTRQRVEQILDRAEVAN